MPSNKYVPDVGRSKHPMMFNSVDLPDPEGPVMDSHSPRLSQRSTSTSACTAGSTPYCLPTLLKSKTRGVSFSSFAVMCRYSGAVGLVWRYRLSME